jgi:hypothetical protein
MPCEGEKNYLYSRGVTSKLCTVTAYIPYQRDERREEVTHTEKKSVTKLPERRENYLDTRERREKHKEIKRRTRVEGNYLNSTGK